MEMKTSSPLSCGGKRSAAYFRSTDMPYLKAADHVFDIYKGRQSVW